MYKKISKKLDVRKNISLIADCSLNILQYLLRMQFYMKIYRPHLLKKAWYEETKKARNIISTKHSLYTFMTNYTTKLDYFMKPLKKRVVNFKNIFSDLLNLIPNCLVIVYGTNFLWSGISFSLINLPHNHLFVLLLELTKSLTIFGK